MTREAELQAIDAAIRAGRLQRLPMGATSGWDELTLKERKSISWTNAKKAVKVREVASRER